MGGFLSSRVELTDQIFNLKFTAKQLIKQSAKCEKEEEKEKLKVSKFIPHSIECLQTLSICYCPVTSPSTA